VILSNGLGSAKTTTKLQQKTKAVVQDSKKDGSSTAD